MILFDLLLYSNWDQIEGYDDLKNIIESVGKPSNLGERINLHQRLLLHIYGKPFEQWDIFETQAIIIARSPSYADAIRSWTNLKIYRESLVDEIRNISENIIDIDSDAIILRFDYLDNVRALYKAAEYYFFRKGNRSSRSYFYYTFNVNVDKHNQVVQEIEKEKNILKIDPNKYHQYISSKKVIDEIIRIAYYFQNYATLKFGYRVNFNDPVEFISNPLRDHELVALHPLPGFIQSKRKFKPETFTYEKCVIIYHLLSVHWIGQEKSFFNILDQKDFNELFKDANTQNLGDPPLQRYIIEQVKRAIDLKRNRTR